jgi:hypothetical protein
MFFELRVEIVGRVARLRKDTILAPNRIRNVLEEQIGKLYSRGSLARALISSQFLASVENADGWV